MTNVLLTQNVYDKITQIESCLGDIFSGKKLLVPQSIGRDALVVPVCELPQRPGLSHKKGQGRLVYDLASIELQAMELCVRTLIEFPDAPAEFRKELSDLCLSESRHLKACLDAIEKLDCHWGEWPVHTALWSCVSEEDTLLDRILIVHRYLEGSGLDASDGILKKLNGVDSKISKPVVSLIATEELGHVMFGNTWYKKICQDQLIEPEVDFKSRIYKVKRRLPRRLEKINRDLRLRSGFSQSEIEILESFRLQNLK